MTHESIINKKEHKKLLNKKEIEYFVFGYINNLITNETMTRFLKAIIKNGLTEKEILFFVKTYIDSGLTIDYEGINVCDKHSTGGIGDKVSIILVPLLHSMGVKIGKLSGRGLGFTGGTIDKFESIKNFKINLSINDFKNQVLQHGMAISSATKELCPADKKIYALRDVTNTVKNDGLIAASIMSKKIASGANIILLDIKFGSGAFFETKKIARKFGKLCEKIAREYKKDFSFITSDMNKPLGKTIGNGIEIKEAIEVLKGKGTKELIKNVVLAASIIKNKYDKTSIKKSKKIAFENLRNNKAYSSFEKLILLQGGDLNFVKNEKFFQPKYSKKVSRNAIPYNLKKASEFGKLAIELGAGRKNMNDKIDYHAGIQIDGKKLILYSSKEIKI